MKSMRTNFRAVSSLARVAGALAASAVLAACIWGCSDGDAKVQSHGAPPPMVKVLTVVPGDRAYHQEYVGQTAGSREVEVRARVDGILLRRVYVEGAYVERGELMFEIEPQTNRALLTEAQGDLQRLKADLQMSRLNKDRVVKLFSSGAVSAQERDDAVTGYDAAMARVSAAEAKLDQARIKLDYTEVRAPISGISSMEAVSEGDLVKAGTEAGLLTTITQLDPLYVNFAIPATRDLEMRGLVKQGLLSLPKEGYAVALQLPNRTFYGREGYVNFRDKHVDPAIGSIRCRAEFRNPEHELLPGEIVRVHLRGAILKNVMTVPQRAVMFTQQGPMVFVLDAENTAEARPVVLSDPVGEVFIVYDGIKPGERIVAEGVIKVRSGAKVTPIKDKPATKGKDGA